MTRNRPGLVAGAALLISLVNPALASPSRNAFTVVPQLTTTPTAMASTVPIIPNNGPGNGDVNPYGVAFVPNGFPSLPFSGPQVGDIFVSNFNNMNNLQGTGTTIVQIPKTAQGSSVLFFQDNATPGLSTALGVLKGGLVVVGNVPSIFPQGNPPTLGTCTVLQRDVGPGGLTFLDGTGAPVDILLLGTKPQSPQNQLTSTSLFAAGFSADLLDGPWDLTIADDDGAEATIFVSNVLTGTVTRLNVEVDLSATQPIAVTAATQIAHGYTHECDPAAFVVAPTGLALDENTDILYVASTKDNNIFAVQNASVTSDKGTGMALVPPNVVSKNLRGPLGLVLAPNGDLVSSQGDAVNAKTSSSSEIVELTPGGQFVAQFSIAPRMPGGAFGIAIFRSLNQMVNTFSFAAVNDANNTLEIWDVP